MKNHLRSLTVRDDVVMIAVFTRYDDRLSKGALSKQSEAAERQLDTPFYKGLQASRILSPSDCHR